MVLILLLFLFASANGLRVTGDKDKKGQDWVFVEKFCYSDDGLGTLSIKTHSFVVGDLIVLYNDSVWDHVYSNRHKLTCNEKLKFSKGIEPIMSTKEPISVTFRDAAPHFWYVAAANCELGKNEDLNLSYSMVFLNPGNSWQHQFSYDHQGLAEMYLFFWLFFCVIIIPAHLYANLSTLGIKASFTHPISRATSIILFFQTGALFSHFTHWIIFKGNGIGAPSLLGLGEILNYAAQIFFYTLLIAVAMGYPLTIAQVPNKIFLMGFICVFTLAFMALFIWHNLGVDSASTIYIYDTIPGLLLVAAVVLAWLLFLYFLWKTANYEKDPDKRIFYIAFGGLFSFWFLAFPFLVGLAALLPPWFRFKVITGAYLSLFTIAMISLVLATWPSLHLKSASEESPPSETAASPLLKSSFSSSERREYSSLLTRSDQGSPTDHKTHYDEL